MLVHGITEKPLSEQQQRVLIFNALIDLKTELPYSNFPMPIDVENDKITLEDIYKELAGILSTVNPLYINRNAIIRG